MCIRDSACTDVGLVTEIAVLVPPGASTGVAVHRYVTVHAYDILLEVLLINQTSEPMHNLCLELAVVGDLKLCERPQPYVLLPGENKHVKANIKVSSTETGIVFGSIVWDAPGSTGAKETSMDKHCVVLNDIHIDIMDYIAPASCSDPVSYTHLTLPTICSV